jgi:hypothetical protein
MITEQQVREALVANAERDENGRWGFHGGYPMHEEASALAITRACLILGVRVTDTLSGTTWCAVVDRIAAIERRLETAEMGA